MRRYPPANRKEELELFERMVAGETETRILFLEADGGRGKTTLLAEFVRRRPETVPCVPIDLKGDPGLAEVLDRLGGTLGWEKFPRLVAGVRRLSPGGAGRDAGDYPHLRRDRYPLAALHDLLADAFTAPDLRRFCRYRSLFAPILDLFAENANLEAMIEAVLTYCQRQVLFSELLVEIREANFRQYQRHYARLYGLEASAAPTVDVEAARAGDPLDRTEIEAALRAADEADRASRRAALTRALFGDLRAWPGRVALLFDTCEQASPEVQEWLAGPCLANAHGCPNLAVVVAGRKTPEESIEWAACCLHRTLPPLEDADVWDEYSRRNGWNVPRPWIEGYCAATRGDPNQMNTLLASAAGGGGGRP